MATVCKNYGVSPVTLLAKRPLFLGGAVWFNGLFTGGVFVGVDDAWTPSHPNVRQGVDLRAPDRQRKTLYCWEGGGLLTARRRQALAVAAVYFIFVLLAAFSGSLLA